MKYYQAINTGKGFITHSDNEFAHISGYPGDIWVTENENWANRIGAIEKTKEEAQAIVNSAISGSTYTLGENIGEQVVIILP